MMETDVLTVAAGVRSAIHLYAKNGNDVSGEDFSEVKSFLTSPGSFMATKVAPHLGTYNTQSTAIQGILSEMYDTFERDLESAIEEEGERQSAHDELMATKRKDQRILEATLIEKTKESCKAKADEWAERSRLRTEELAGIGQAIDILTSDEATAIFKRSDTTFVQLSVKTKDDARTRAYNILKETAS